MLASNALSRLRVRLLADLSFRPQQHLKEVCILRENLVPPLTKHLSLRVVSRLASSVHRAINQALKQDYFSGQTWGSSTSLYRNHSNYCLSILAMGGQS